MYLLGLLYGPIAKFGIFRTNDSYDYKETSIKFDWLSTLLVTLLIATLLAFFTGIFPYPYGWIILTIVLIARLRAISRMNDS